MATGGCPLGIILSQTWRLLVRGFVPCGGPNGIRTRVLALRGLRPRPLDDGATLMCWQGGDKTTVTRWQGLSQGDWPSDEVVVPQRQIRLDVTA